MKKWMIIVAGGAAAVGAVVTARNCMSMCSAESERPTMWDKMRAHMEEMPEDFPPRIMFDNTQATRENTERILDLLNRRDAPREPELLTEVAV